MNHILKNFRLLYEIIIYHIHLKKKLTYNPRGSLSFNRIFDEMLNDESFKKLRTM